MIIKTLSALARENTPASDAYVTDFFSFSPDEEYRVDAIIGGYRNRKNTSKYIGVGNSVRIDDTFVDPDNINGFYLTTGNNPANGSVLSFPSSSQKIRDPNTHYIFVAAGKVKDIATGLVPGFADLSFAKFLCAGDVGTAGFTMQLADNSLHTATLTGTFGAVPTNGSTMVVVGSVNNFDNTMGFIAESSVGGKIENSGSTATVLNELDFNKSDGSTVLTLVGGIYAGVAIYRITDAAATNWKEIGLFLGHQWLAGNKVAWAGPFM